MRIHLVLASGGVRCLSYAGAIAALENRGFRFASVSACSAGTFLAALTSAGKMGGELVELAEALDLRSLRGRARGPWSIFSWPHAKYSRAGFSDVVLEVL